MIATSSVVCSFLFILFNWSKNTHTNEVLQLSKRQNKRLFVWLRVVFDVDFNKHDSSLFIVLSTFNEITNLILSINHFETAPRS